MKKIILAGLFACSAVASYAQASFSRPQNATDCSNAFFKALLDEDSSTLNDILADDFSIVSFDGQQVDREMLSQGVAQGYIVVDTGITSGIRTRDYGDVGVVTGIWNVKGKLENSSFQNEVSYTAISVKKGGSWKISVVQLTPIR